MDRVSESKSADESNSLRYEIRASWDGSGNDEKLSTMKGGWPLGGGGISSI